MPFDEPYAPRLKISDLEEWSSPVDPTDLDLVGNHGEITGRGNPTAFAVVNTRGGLTVVGAVALASGDATLDLETASTFVVAADADFDMVFDNVPATTDVELDIRVIINWSGTSTGAINWGATSVLWAGGTEPSWAGATGTDMLRLVSVDGGDNWIGWAEALDVS